MKGDCRFANLEAFSYDVTYDFRDQKRMQVKRDVIGDDPEVSIGEKITKS